jgi:hypothetical protein
VNDEVRALYRDCFRAGMTRHTWACLTCNRVYLTDLHGRKHASHDFRHRTEVSVDEVQRLSGMRFS